MNLLQYIEYQTSTITGISEWNGVQTYNQYIKYTFIYIDKEGHKYNGLYTIIPTAIHNDPVAVQNRLKNYLRNISLDEYEYMLYEQNSALTNAK